MNSKIRSTLAKWGLLSLLLIIYKILLDFLFFRVYYTVYSYLTNAVYEIVPSKLIISYVILGIFILLLINSFANANIYSVIITIVYTLCIVPMLSSYAVVSYVSVYDFVWPTIFWIIFVLSLRRFSSTDNGKKRLQISIPTINPASTTVLIGCVLIGLLCWSWAGFPILLSISDSLVQRLELRENSMPTLLAYAFTILGGTIMPYLFARFLIYKRYMYAAISLIVGYLLYSVNGMKTWLFLYAVVLIVYYGCKVFKNNCMKLSYSIIISLCLLLVLCVYSYVAFGMIDFLSQFGRIFCIPSGIGYQSLHFFSENELLYLRESILRHLFESPYPGGSDFYMDYGANRTITSGRSNNGLWGDAYRNFGVVGIILYPIVIAKIVDIIRYSFRRNELAFTVFILFAMIWNSINVSFFTWLLSGGVIIVLLLNKLFAIEDYQWHKPYLYEDRSA